MWSIILLSGFVLLVVGVFKRTTNWGKGAALIGATGIIVSLLVAGPELLDTVQQGFQDGYEAGAAADSAN